MNQNSIKYSLLGASLLITTLAIDVKADAAPVWNENPVAGITVSLDKYYQNTQETSIAPRAAFASTTFLTKEEKRIIEEAAVAAAAQAAIEAEQYKNIGIANVEKYLNIRQGADEKSSILGKIPANGGCYIDSIDENGWAKVKSGDITGYVLSDYLITGEAVPALAKQVGKKVATVNEQSVRIRAEMNTESEIIASVGTGEDLTVLDDSNPEWVKVSIANAEGYIYAQYVTVSFQLSKAIPFVEETITATTSTSVSSSVSSSLRSQIVSYAKKFLGNRYVYGGTSLTGGIDCSGFTMRIYQKFGYNISRTSRSQAVSGTPIKVSQVKPGDLVFYNNGGGAIDHVAMYIGNGKIIHASNPRSGIKISNMNYKAPCKAVRFIKD